MFNTKIQNHKPFHLQQCHFVKLNSCRLATLSFIIALTSLIHRMTARRALSYENGKVVLNARGADCVILQTHATWLHYWAV